MKELLLKKIIIKEKFIKKMTLNGKNSTHYLFIYTHYDLCHSYINLGMMGTFLRQIVCFQMNELGRFSGGNSGFRCTLAVKSHKVLFASQEG